MTEQFFFDTPEILADLNSQQRKAVKCLDGPLLIMAGAGSGKTRVLTYRLANLIAQGIPPKNILAITFTNKAANEMKSRAMKLIGAPARHIVMSTFHSFCARLLRREIEITGEFDKNFAIYDTTDTKILIKQCVAELNLEEKKFAGVQFKISDLKNNLIDPAHYAEQIRKGETYKKNVAQVYELYQKKLRENNALDFDDLIFAAVKIFQKYPEVLERYRERFKYISIDEYQDTNEAQYVLTKLLADKYQNICVVGDADQSIYGWRGADMRNILNFERDYPGARVILLEENYRSTQIILNAANAVIAHNFDRKPKTLWTRNENGEKIKFVLCKSDKAEASIVAREIQRLVSQENFLYNEIALLYRTNAQSQKFEEQFMNAGIPYIVVGGLKFYDRKEIRDIVAYLHVIINPRDTVHLLQIINTPRRGIGAANLNRVKTFADSLELSILELVADGRLLGQLDLPVSFRTSIKEFAAMMLSLTESAKNLPVDELIKIVLNESGYLRMLKENSEDGKAENISREENLGAFVNTAKDFVEMNPDGTLEDFLNHIALITDVDIADGEDSRVKLMTVHAAKGLEFPAVFVAGMEDGLFPHVNEWSDEDDLEEERRACYVALTRAEKKLYITAAEQRMYYGKLSSQEISRFVEEIPDNCLARYDYGQHAAQKKNPPVKKTPPPQPVYKPPTAYRAAQITKPPQKISAPPASNIAWRVGEKVQHKMWGLGTVVTVDSKIITVAFVNPEVGVKKLSIKAAPITKI